MALKQDLKFYKLYLEEGYMLKLRDVVIFFAGAEFFHTISHLILPYFVVLPLDMKFMIFTASLNKGAIILNALITIGLLWWASRLKSR